MEGPFPAIHKNTVAALFGPEAMLTGNLGTPTIPGSLAIVVGEQVLGTGPDFGTVLEAAARRASELVERN